jgi:hypothetical protein
MLIYARVESKCYVHTWQIASGNATLAAESGATPMQGFAEFFSFNSITKELCKARLRLADVRHDAVFFHEIDKSRRAAEDVPIPPAWREISSRIFPGRKLWNKYRSKDRTRQVGPTAATSAPAAPSFRHRRNVVEGGSLVLRPKRSSRKRPHRIKRCTIPVMHECPLVTLQW